MRSDILKSELCIIGCANVRPCKYGKCLTGVGTKFFNGVAIFGTISTDIGISSPAVVCRWIRAACRLVGVSVPPNDDKRIF